MKKQTIIILAALALFVGMSSAAFSAQTCNTAGGASFDIDDGTYTLTFNVSPGVEACYWSDAAGTAGNIQWFAIGTFHGGGNTGFGTASSFTSLYTRDIKALTTKTTSTVFAGIVDTAASAGTWSGWSKK